MYPRIIHQGVAYPTANFSFRDDAFKKNIEIKNKIGRGRRCEELPPLGAIFLHYGQGLEDRASFPLKIVTYVPNAAFQARCK